MQLKLGILAIGSLYWDASPARQKWRESLTDERVYVSAHIRYGRKSSSRGDTYTMVFSSSAGPGQARVLSARPVNSPEDLIGQAVSLWTAEKNGTTQNRSISAKWGCVVLCRNPKRRLPESFLNAWLEKIQTERSNYSAFTVAQGECNLVTHQGMLDIAWPVDANGSELDFDMLLATANYPFAPGNLQPYPSPKQVADAWLASPQHANYFHSNRQHGIFTFQDREIARFLGLTEFDTV